VVIFFPGEYSQDADGRFLTCELFGHYAQHQDRENPHTAPPISPTSNTRFFNDAATIRELFAKPVERPIDGVIKADARAQPQGGARLSM